MVSKKRLIYADALIATLEKIAKEDETNYFHLDEITQEIFDAPIVDAVEVVRCKDCKECIKNPRSAWFDGFCVLNRVDTLDNDFCSYGERKDNERKAD